MNIINNNGPFSYDPPPSPDGGKNVLTMALEEVRSGGPVSRNTYITLAKYLGFLGVHYFAVRRWGCGLFHCLLTVIGAAAASGVMFTILSEPEYQEEILGGCLFFSLCLPASILTALASSCYWFFHTDQEFDRIFYLKRQFQKSGKGIKKSR